MMKNTGMADWRLMLSHPLNGDIEKRYDELISFADNLLARDSLNAPSGESWCSKPEAISLGTQGIKTREVGAARQARS